MNIVTTVPLRTEVTVEALVRDGDRPFTLRAAGWVVRKGKTGTAVQFRDLDGETARVIRSLVQIGADGS